jgi:hypothetical protein
MEQWFTPTFDASKAAWKKGQMPFAQLNGKLATKHSTGTTPDTQWLNTPRTLWENEVLLVNQKFDLPPLKSGYSYRLRVDRGQGVGAGDGFKIFINGKPLIESKEGLGRRMGDTIRGAWITEEFKADFAKGPITIAAITFLRYGDRAIVQMPPVPQGIFSMWLEERQLPPLDHATLAKAAQYMPLLTSSWQDKNNPTPQNDEPQDNPPFFYDGKFVNNPGLVGTWTTVDSVKSIEDYTPSGKKQNIGRPAFPKLTLAANGATDTPRFLWSGDTLMDADQRAALKMTHKTMDGSDYLFVESGGFSVKNPVGWKTTFTVLKK